MRPHAADRAKERYGVNLTHRGIKRLERKIAVGDSTVLDNSPQGVHHAVQVGTDGPIVHLIYNPETRQIITILPIRRQLPKRVGLPSMEFPPRQLKRRGAR